MDRWDGAVGFSGSAPDRDIISRCPGVTIGVKGGTACGVSSSPDVRTLKQIPLKISDSIIFLIKP